MKLDQMHYRRAFETAFRTRYDALKLAESKYNERLVLAAIAIGARCERLFAQFDQEPERAVYDHALDLIGRHVEDCRKRAEIRQREDESLATFLALRITLAQSRN